MNDFELTHSLPRAVYVHVPFCIHRCGYCDFTVIADRDDLLEEYLACLELDIRQGLKHPQPVDTLFIGGGTPNYLPASQLQKLLVLLQAWFPLNEGGEASIECNPESLTADRMSVLAESRINRISLGVQSFQASHLATLERGHTAEAVRVTVEQLRDFGFQNVSLDLIFAVPNQTLAEWDETLRDAITLQPEHLSTYGLTYEKGTSFWTRRMKKTLTPVDESVEREMYDRAMTFLSHSGYAQYELSNHALPGFECRHNQVYWDALPYFGFGPGAAALVDGERTTRCRSVTGWIKRLRSGNSPITERELRTPELAAREGVMLGLRRTAGIDMHKFQQRYGRTVESLAPQAFHQFVNQGLLETDREIVRLSRAGRFLADTVVAEFL